MPSSFPQKIISVDHASKDNLIGWYSNYRKYDNGETEAFNYFVTRIVAAISPSVTQFQEKKKNCCISKIFSESDEAFALLIMCNEFHRWKEDADALENGEKQNNKRSRKTFVDPKSGSKVGWSKDGLELFNNLLRLVRHLRKAHNTGSQLEEAMRVQFAQENSVTDETTPAPVVADQHFVDEMMVEMEYDPQIFESRMMQNQGDLEMEAI